MNRTWGASIGDLVDTVSTWNPQRDGHGTFDYLDLSSVDQATKAVAAASLTECSAAPSRARQLVRTDDILVSTVRPNLNAVARVTSEFDGATASTGFCVLRPSPSRLDPSYLFHWVRTPLFVNSMTRSATGASYPAVSDRIVKESPIPLFPLDEQRRIAAILDNADALRRKRKRGIALLEGLAQSIFLEMFGEPAENSRDWQQRPLGSLALRVSKGESPGWQGFKYKDHGIRFVTSENVGRGVLVEKDKFIPEQFHSKLRRSALREDDLLINLVGASVGRAALVSANLLPANINQAVSVTTLDQDKILPRFALAQVLTSGMQRRLLGEVVEVARANLSLTNIRQLVVIVPPMKLQEAFEERIAAVGRLGSLVNAGARADDALFAALQHRAFAGQL